MQDLTSSVIQGFPIGCVFALVAIGFVLTYKVSGVFNLAFGAQAFAAAAVYYVLRVNHGWPTPCGRPRRGPRRLAAARRAAVLRDLPLSADGRAGRPARGVDRAARRAPRDRAHRAAARELAAVRRRRHRRQRRHARTTSSATRSTATSSRRSSRRSRSSSASRSCSATRTIGLRMRAVVESARMTELAGISADRVSSVGWALSSILAGMAGVLLGPLFPQLSAQNFFLLIVAAIAAAAFAGLSSLPLALVGGLALGIGGADPLAHAPDEQHPRAGPAPVVAVRRAVLRADPQAVAASGRRSSPTRSPASTRRRPRSRRVERGPGLTRATHVFETAVCVGLVSLVRVRRQRVLAARSRRRR